MNKIIIVGIEISGKKINIPEVEVGVGDRIGLLIKKEPLYFEMGEIIKDMTWEDVKERKENK